MNDPQKEARRRLEDEERIRRLREGGESMRAQLAIEEAQRSRAGRETTGFSGLTPEEEERRRLMSGEGVPHAGLGETQRATMYAWGREQRGPEGGEGPTMEDRIAREIRAERRPTGVPGPTPAEQMAEMDREREAIERSRQGDLGRAGGGTYYYGGRESQARGEASPGSYFSGGERMPPGRPPIEAQPTAGERMRERGEGMAASAGRTGERMVSRTRGVGEQAMDRTKEYGRRLSERTREATGGASAEEMAAQAGESIGRGIRKVVAVGSGILSGLRRGVGETSREREYEQVERRESREWSEEGRESMPPSEYRETEYREVRKRDEPKR